jgi:cytochrome c biogenesis protein CcmG/thiol:disulfide interchange protein DsbE
MTSRSAIVLGLVAGALTVAVVFVVLVAALPEGTAVPTPTPPPTASTAPSPSPGTSGTSAPSASPGSSADEAFMVGQAAPELVVEQLGGGTIDLANLMGKPVWINFMATWCPPCRDELPKMVDFATRYADDGLVVIAVDVNEDEATVSPFVSDVGVTFPVGLDPDGKAQTAWRAAVLPVHYWIDATGVIRAGAAGGIGPDIMAENLATILPGVDVQP